jgi:hypothetical protein
MSDPIVSFRNSGVMEIVDGNIHHFIRREAIQTVMETSYRIGIYMYGRADALFLTFADKKTLAVVLNSIITGLSVDEPVGPTAEVMKEMMEKIQEGQKELANSFVQVTSKLEDFKNDIQTEMSNSMDELSERVSSLEDSEEVEEEEEDSDITPVMKTNSYGEMFILVFVLLFMISVGSHLNKGI